MAAALVRPALLRALAPLALAVRRGLAYSTRTMGAPGTHDFRVFFFERGASGAEQPISPWLHIPLDAGDGLLHCVVEIPRGTTAKMEIDLLDELHPIKQDVNSDGSLRFIKHGPVLCNYGFLPQTFEDPASADALLDALGDGDALDVIELSQRPAAIGQVLRVKPLGILPLLDQGEADWKLVAIAADDPRAAALNGTHCRQRPLTRADIGDVAALMPGRLDALLDWYRNYKRAEGKAANTYGLDGRAQSRATAERVVRLSHDFFRHSYGADGDGDD